MAISASKKDLYSGAIFVAVGAYFVVESLNYDIGTPLRMGPGFMPVALGGVLAALGLAIIIGGLNKPDAEIMATPPWRAIILILGTIIFFATTIRGLGFIPVVLISAMLTAFSSRSNGLVFALALGVGLTVLCTLVFVIGLGLIVPLFGPWLPF